MAQINSTQTKAMTSPDITTNLRQRYHAVRQRIDQASADYLRSPGTVDLLAVSKRHPASAIEEIYALGQRDFGESYAAEAVEKICALANLEINWHFIGPLQANKTRLIAEHCHWVHSVDRLKLVNRLSAQRPKTLSQLNVCLQLKIGAEDSKSGARADEIMSLAQATIAAPGLRLRGLMAIPPPRATKAEQRSDFAELALLFQQLKTLSSDVDTLSMGMSADMESAIAEGSTMVRIGTDIFGPR